MFVTLGRFACLSLVLLFSGLVFAQDANDVGRNVTAPGVNIDGPAGDSPLECVVQSGFSGQNTQSGRIFRDAIPSTCPGKTYPGIFDAAGSYYYETYTFSNDSNSTVCTTVEFNPDAGATPCGTNAHASAYVGSYDPANQGTNYVGDVGSSLAQPFSFDIPALSNLVLVVTNTAGVSTCTFGFEVNDIQCGVDDGRATFEVFKEFTDGDNPTEAEVTIECFTGLPLTQSQTITEDQSVEFVVTDFDDGELDCVISENLDDLEGYTPTYFAGGPNASSDEDGCHFNDLSVFGENSCSIVNEADPVDIDIEKIWVIEGPSGDEVDTGYRLTLHCDSPIVGGQECGGSMVSSPEGSDSYSYPFCKKFYGDSSQNFVGQVYPEYPESHCWVDERVYDDSVEVSNGCGNLVVSAGEGTSCVIVNTVFFEGIPTLSRYGMAIMALLMLGLGLVTFRRMV